ncbi:hypothetical protein PAXINDRAFT_171554, partial [Paxillus involutus ATCC 200175]
MSQAALSLLLAGLAYLLGNRPSPTVTLRDSATVRGLSSGYVNELLGIPFAQPPTGQLRFQLPQALPPSNTSFSATAYGPAYPQQAMETLDYLTFLNSSIVVTPSTEDCLTLNIIAPSDATPESKLPVVVWVYGGGFEIGGTSGYNGPVIVEKAVSLGLPVIYVSINYRQEVKDAEVGHLGLQDQRLALYWVQKYINAFGGDTTKVTIWGESAEAISAALHMVTNDDNPNGLFRAAFMQSGSPFPVGDISQGQKYYDALVSETRCSSASDTLQCLREVPYETLLDAVNQSPRLFSYQSTVLAWQPRVDGVFLTDEPQKLVQQGSVADVPFVTGTLFSFSTLNITTDAQFEEYLQIYRFPEALPTTIQELMEFYSANISQGSPFDTGVLNAITPQFKRIAAFQGDVTFEALRRFLLQHRSGKQPLWTYVTKRLKTFPVLGS